MSSDRHEYFLQLLKKQKLVFMSLSCVKFVNNFSFKKKNINSKRCVKDRDNKIDRFGMAGQFYLRLDESEYSQVVSCPINKGQAQHARMPTLISCQVELGTHAMLDI